MLYYFPVLGWVAERSKAPVLKTDVRYAYRGFESLPICHKLIINVSSNLRTGQQNLLDSFEN